MFHISCSPTFHIISFDHKHNIDAIHLFRILTSFLSNVDFHLSPNFQPYKMAGKIICCVHSLFQFVELGHWRSHTHRIIPTIASQPVSQQPEFCATMFCDCSPHLPAVFIEWRILEMWDDHRELKHFHWKTFEIQTWLDMYVLPKRTMENVWMATAMAMANQRQQIWNK